MDPKSAAESRTRRDVALTLGSTTLSGLLFLLYEPLNHGPARWTSHLPLDDRLPLVTVFAVPYVSIFAVALVTVVVFWFRAIRRLNSVLVAGILTLATSFLIYTFAQSKMDRPDITGDDPFSALVRFVYGSDQPYNAFPSLHVGFSVILGLHWIWFDRRIGAAVACWCALIAASTVLIGQHYLLDIAGGVLVGGAASVAARSISGSWRR